MEALKTCVALAAFAMLLQPSLAVAAIPVEKLSPYVAFLRKDNAKTSSAGTGFFVSSDKHLFLVTASHVARIMTVDSSITIATKDGKPFRFHFSDLVTQSKDLPWHIHPKADIAVLRIIASPDFVAKNLGGHFFPIAWLERAKEAPLRALTLTILGFPLELGVSEYFSPISKDTKAASGLLEIPRADNRAMATFFVIQDPSIGGFSGAPLFDTRMPYSKVNVGILVEMGLEPRVLGLVHGTISDNTGGKLGAIVPAFLIIEALEGAISSEGK